jgi:hypothetical protein
MAKPTTRAQFKDYCLRRLGHPVIEINVDDDQVEDRIDDALAFFHDYHFDGCQKMFMKHKVTQIDIDRKWIYCPDSVLFVTGVLPFDNSTSSVNMFDMRYQLRLHDLYDFTSVSYVSYEITMQHITTLNMLFSGMPQFRFNRHMNKIFLDIDWSRDVMLNEYLVMECYRKLDPDTMTVEGTANVSASNVMVVGTGTTFTRDILIGDEINFDTQVRTVVEINSDIALNVSSAFTTTNTAITLTKDGITDIWNDRFLKKYATEKIKYQWGTNLSKFASVQLPGGVTLDGPRIMQEAQAEIDKIEEEMQSYNVLPNDMFIG